MPEPHENEIRKEFIERCIPIVLDDGTAEDSAQAIAVCNSMWDQREEKREWIAKSGNALKTVSKTDAELCVANYIVLFDVRDLTGAPSQEFLTGPLNSDGSHGEFFTKATRLESPYTATGHLLIDWEHGEGKAVDGRISPGRNDIFGFVDWKTAEIDDLGVWVERVLNRRSKYMQWVETLINEGIIGTSSEAIGNEIAKKASGEITCWPLERDTFTVTPMEHRMMSENALQAMKSLGLKTELSASEPEPEAQSEADKSLAVEAAKARAVNRNIKIKLSLMEANI